MKDVTVTVEIDAETAQQLRMIAIHHAHTEDDELAQDAADALSEALADVDVREKLTG